MGLFARLAGYFGRPLSKTNVGPSVGPTVGPTSRKIRKPRPKNRPGSHIKVKLKPDYHQNPRAPWHINPVLIAEVKRYSEKFGVPTSELVELAVREFFYHRSLSQIRKKVELAEQRKMD